MRKILIAVGLAFAGFITAAAPDVAHQRALGQQVFYRYVYEFTVFHANNAVIQSEVVPVVASNDAEAERIAGQVGNNLLVKWAGSEPGAYCRRQLLRVE